MSAEAKTPALQATQTAPLKATKPEKLLMVNQRTHRLVISIETGKARSVKREFSVVRQ